MDQQAIIDRAHESRSRDRLPSGLSTLTFFREPLNDDGLALLAEQRPDLEGLFLVDSDVTDGAIPTLSSFPHLSELDIYSTKVTAEGLALFNGRSLTTINLQSTQFSPAVGQMLASMETLRHFNIGFMSFSRSKDQAQYDSAFVQLAQSKSIESIRTYGVQIDGACLPSLAKLPLNELIMMSTKCPAEPIRALAKCNTLKTLGISHSQLDDDSLAILLASLNLDDLWISGTCVTDRSIDSILATQQLKSIAMEECDVTNAALMKLAQMKSLGHVEILNSRTNVRFERDFLRRHGGDLHLG